jgi:hypothetical protein
MPFKQAMSSSAHAARPLSPSSRKPVPRIDPAREADARGVTATLATVHAGRRSTVGRAREAGCDVSVLR